MTHRHERVLLDTSMVIDFPGEAFTEGQGPSAQFLAQLARCDALIHVVRGFHDETVPHPSGSVDAARPPC